MPDKYYFEFQCLGCDSVWLMEGKKVIDTFYKKPTPKFCPNCGVKFEEIVSKDTAFPELKNVANKEEV